MNALIALFVIVALVVLVVAGYIVYAVVENRKNDTRELFSDRALLREQLNVAKTELRTIAMSNSQEALGASLALDAINSLQEKHDNQEELTR